MAAFCSNCGGKLDLGTKFCVQCGQAVMNSLAPAAQSPVNAAPPVAAPAAVAQPAAAVATGGGGLLKIILVVCGVIGLGVLMAGGACFYVGYRIHKKAHELSATYSLNSTPYQGTKDACRLVTKSEVSEAFGMQVSSMTGSDNHCDFVFNGDNTRQMAYSVTWQGGTMLMKISHGMMKNISAGMDTFTPVQGLGDEAYVEPMGSGLMLRKGDVMVNIDLRGVSNNADAAKMIAMKIVERL